MLCFSYVQYLERNVSYLYIKDIQGCQVWPILTIETVVILESNRKRSNIWHLGRNCGRHFNQKNLRNTCFFCQKSKLLRHIWRHNHVRLVVLLRPLSRLRRLHWLCLVNAKDSHEWSLHPKIGRHQQTPTGSKPRGFNHFSSFWGCFGRQFASSAAAWEGTNVFRYK